MDPRSAWPANMGEYKVSADNMPRPETAESTTKICDKPLSGASKRSVNGVLLAITVSETVTVPLLVANGLARNNMVRVTKLKAYVNCGLLLKVCRKLIVVMVAAEAPAVVIESAVRVEASA